MLSTALVLLIMEAVRRALSAVLTVLIALGIAADMPVKGMAPDSSFVRSIREGDDTVPYEVLREEVLATAEDLLREHNDIGAIVSECTNLAPYSANIADRLGVPVYDTVSMVNWFYAGLRPRRYAPD